MARNIDVVKEKRGSMGRLYDLIQEHMDAQAPYRISERQVAQQLGVTQTTLANWREPKKLISKKHLVAIARLTRNPYKRVLDALLEDIDYLDERSGGDERSAASMKVPASRRQLVEQLRRALDAGAIDQAEFDRRMADLDDDPPMSDRRRA